MMRDDSNKPFWKENFVNGLSNLFAHKIMEELSKNLGYIDYDNLTYGDIISQIQKTCFKMCIDFKISKQANKDKNKAKYELGSLCEQYGLPPIAPSRKKHKKKINKDKRNKHKRKSNTQDDYYKKKSSSKKRNYKPKGKSSKTYTKSNVICHSCGKKGHYKNECKVKEKLSQLNISDDDTEQILKLMKLENNSSDNEYPSSDIPSSSDNSSNEFDNQSSPRISLGCKDNCNNTCCNKRLNVLTKVDEETILLKLIFLEYVKKNFV